MSSSNGMKNEEEKISKMSKTSSEYWRAKRRFTLAFDFKEVLDASNKLKGLTIRYSNPSSHEMTITKDKLFSDHKGFQLSKDLSEDGFKKAVKGAVWYLINNKHKLDLGKSIVTCRKNLNNSIEATKELINVVADLEPGKLPENIRKKIVLIELEPLIAQFKLLKSAKDKALYLDESEKKIEIILSKQGCGGSSPTMKKDSVLSLIHI